MFTSQEVSDSKVRFTAELELMNMQKNKKSFHTKCPITFSENPKVNESHCRKLFNTFSCLFLLCFVHFIVCSVILKQNDEKEKLITMMNNNEVECCGGVI